jgi:uncharacterized membrane protein YbhN (UPF0104 family)
MASTKTSRWLHVLSLTGSIAMLLVAVWILHHYLSHIRWDDVATAWSRLPATRIAWSILAMLLSFSMLALFDVVASRIAVGDRVSAGLSAFAGAVTHGISNTLGFHALTGSAVRYRIYRSAGLGAGDIARIVSLAGLGVGLGFVVVLTGALCREPQITSGWGRWPGLALLLLLGIGLIWLARKPRTLTLGSWTLSFPSARTATTQMLIGAIEMLAAIVALYVLLPADIAPPLIDFLPIYVGAVVAGLVSHSPGGLGVFETIMLASFPAEARAELLAAMLCYRLTYSLLPFTLSCLALGIFEIRQRRERRNEPPQFDGG